MSSKLKLNTKDETLRELLANGKKYFVPKFQRDYSWEHDHWRDLWEDIDILAKKKEYHYMGYLVLQEKEDIVFTIIDGQQRFTTFSLIILAAIKSINPKINQLAALVGNWFLNTTSITTTTKSSVGNSFNARSC